jgi:hypothetical protein
MVRFTGSPVHLYQDRMEATGERARYSSATGAARLVGDTGKPLTLTLKRNDGTQSGIVHGDRVDFYQGRDADLAVFTGPGNGSFSDPQKPTDLLKAAWANECDIHLPRQSGAGATAGQVYLKQAELKGDAVVTDGPAAGPDQLRLSAADIAADFDRPPATAAAKVRADQTAMPAASISKVVATGNAYCVIRNPKDPEQSITTDKLTIETARDVLGKAFPRFITAEGNVHALQAGQGELFSNRMDATVAPAKVAANAKNGGALDQSKFQLQSLLASGDVRAKGKSGEAAGDILKVDEQDQNPIVTLLGTPRAVVTSIPQGKASTSDNGTLRGPKITWTQTPGKNLINVDGGVLATSVEADGTRNSAKADHATIELIPKMGGTPPASAPSSNAKVDPLQNKQVREVTLLNNAEVVSDLRAADGSILRRRAITGQEIDAYPALQRLIVPGPGRMLLEDYAKTAKKTQPAAPATAPGGQGATAFQWAKQFTFDEVAGQATFDGPAVIVHQPDGPHAGLTRVLADQVIADFDPKPAAEDQPAGAPRNPQLKRVHATGRVRITTYNDKSLATADKTIEATTIDYDPLAEMLIATGTPDNPVTVRDAQGNITATFQQAWIDTRTNEVRKMTDVQGKMR